MSESQKNSAVKTISDQRTIVLGFICFIVLGIPGGMLGAAWPFMQESFGVSKDDLGILLLASQIGYLGASFGSGPFALRWGSALLLVLGAALRGLGLLGYALAPGWLMMIAIGLPLGLGGGALDAGMNTIFAMRFSPRIMNWLHAAFGLGATLGPLLITVGLYASVSWRWSYAIVAVAQLLILISFLRKRERWHARPDENDQAAVEPSPPSVGSLNLLLTLSIFIFFMTAGLEAATGDWTFTFLSEARNVDLRLAGLLASGFWISFTLGRALFGIFADRIPTLLALRVGMAGAALAGLLIWIPDQRLLAYLGIAVMGFALAPLFPLLIKETPRRLGSARAANAIGFQVGAASIAVAVLPGVMGVLAERISLELFGPYLFASGLLLFALHELMVRLSRLRRRQDVPR